MGSKTRLTYHIILTTKYRKPALSGIEDSVYRAFRDVEKHSSFSILSMGIEDCNHIHLVVSCPPQYSVSGIVSRMKGYTLRNLWESECHVLSKFYWGKKKLWHGGYYADTVGRVSIDSIMDYVKNQDGQPELG